MWHADDSLAPARPSGPLRLHTAADAVRIVGNGLAHSAVEILRLAHLDASGRVIAIGDQQGGHETLPVWIAGILRSACLYGTRQLLIAHNHPSGDPTPSRADRLATRRLAELARALDMAVIDHLVFARGGVASFRALGLI